MGQPTIATVAFRDVERVHPYRYRPQRYAGTFLDRSIPDNGPQNMPSRVFAVWTGTYPLTPNRARGLEELRARLGVPVELVTPTTLDRWLVPGQPLHPAYDHLTLFISLVREPPVPECVEDGLLVVGDRRAESLLGAVDRDGR